MPELPEVETTRRGIAPHLVGHQIEQICIRQAQLRWPISADLAKQATHHVIDAVSRRGKYLLIRMPHGSIILHLGMTGNLAIVALDKAPGKHDHVDFVLNNGSVLRFRDPRRFGSIHWSDAPEAHRLIASMGPEPLGPDFTGQYLYEQAKNRACAVKNFIMDGKVVVGVGNIYANEALFKAGIRPSRAAGRISLARYCALVGHIQATLEEAIDAGGSTLKDFYHSDGKPGYFQFQHLVYQKAGTLCPVCGAVIAQVVIGQRSSFFCAQCQR